MLRNPELSRTNRLLFFIVLTGVILYFGREFFIVITFSGFLAMLMTPLSEKMERRGISRVFSSLISVLIIVLFLAGIVMLLMSQISSLAEDFPQIKASVEESAAKILAWINDSLGLSTEALKKQASDTMGKAGGIVAGVVGGTFAFLGGMLLVLVFTFLFLLQREKYENFVVMLHREEKRNEARRVITDVSKIAQKYLLGRLISIVILGVIFIIGFTILGLKNALLLGAIAAIMTFIPYIGPVIGGLIPFFLALISGSLNQGIWVLLIIAFAQLFDNYFIEPYVVGGSVNIGPFFTIFILLLGGVLWGIAGVILFLPLLGIIHIIFENVEGLKPYAYLIGDEKKKSTGNVFKKIKDSFSKKKK